MNLVSVGVLVVVMSLHSVSCDDEDDDTIEGPLMPLCEGGALCSTAQVIVHQGLTAETHNVTSEDGYLITIFRVLAAKEGAKPVVLQHGFMCSSDCWVSDNKSLAMRLHDAGYDVWLTNMRGNFYGRAHTKLNPDVDNEFWDFSFHEMATKDLPVMIDYILKTTKQPKVDYIGHSLGTTMGLVLLSQKPEYNPKVSSLVLLAPIVHLSKLKDMLGPDGMAEEMAKKYMDDFMKAKKLELFPRKDTPVNKKTQVTCDDIEENFRDMCTEKMEVGKKVMGGWYMPAGQSFKNARHLYQGGVYGEMRKFNGTPEENKIAYDSEEPPKYSADFNKIKPPIIIFAAEEDELVAMEEDPVALMKQLPTVKKTMNITAEGCNHVCFICPTQKSLLPVREKMYDDIISFIKEYGI